MADRSREVWEEIAKSLLEKDREYLMVLAQTLSWLTEDSYEPANRKVGKTAENFLRAILELGSVETEDFQKNFNNLNRIILQTKTHFDDKSLTLTQKETLRVFFNLISKVSLRAEFWRDSRTDKGGEFGSTISLVIGVLTYFEDLIRTSTDLPSTLDDLSSVTSELVNSEDIDEIFTKIMNFYSKNGLI